MIRNLYQVKSEEDSEAADRIIEKSLAEFDFYVNNDLHIPEAIDSLCSLVRKLEALVKKKKLGAGNAKRAIDAIKKMDSVLGFIC